MTVHCWLFGHDFLRAYSPGHVRLRCQACGFESPGLRGPVATVQAPVVKARPKLKAPRATVVPLKKHKTA